MEHQRVINSTILREYDIRGIYEQTFFLSRMPMRSDGPLAVWSQGKWKKVVVGYDGRVSSPDLEAALVNGLKKSGLEVVRIGRGPTPMLYFASTVMQADGAVMVTASHNPKEYNGMKFMLGGKPFFGKQIQDLGAQVAAGDVVPEGNGHSSQG